MLLYYLCGLNWFFQLEFFLSKMYLTYLPSGFCFNGLKVLNMNRSSNIFWPSLSNFNMVSYKQSMALPIYLIDQSWAEKVCVFPASHRIVILMEKWRINIRRDRAIILTEDSMTNTFYCRILSASIVDNASSKNIFYNHAFVYAATNPSITISLLAPVVNSTGYSGESGGYVTHQCLNYVPFPLG